MDKFYFFDMDGTLVEYRRDADVDKMKQQGYFYNLKPEWNMILAMKRLHEIFPNRVYVLTAVYPDEFSFSVDEKYRYMKKIFPFMENNYITVDVPMGETKQDKVSSLIGRSVDKNCLLIDDYSVNLSAWEKMGGKPVKYRNGINNNNNTIHKYAVDCYMTPNEIISNLLEF